MSDAPVYRIKTVHDFAKVPDDRRELCLREFAVWLQMLDATKGLLRGIPVKWPREFVWADDDKHSVTIAVHAGDETIPIVHGRMKGFG